MPLRKGSDGRIYEEPARPAEIGGGDPTVRPGATSPTGADGDRTVIASNNSDAGPQVQDALDEKTQLAGFSPGTSAPQRSAPGRPAEASTQRPGAERAQPGAPTSDRTQLYGSDPDAGVSDDASKICEDPVVGWLVIERGPGRGFFMPLGMGMNSVGRGADQRVRIDFGDRAISKSKHFFVSFDPRSRKFGVHRGDGANLTYLNGAPVYGSEPLEHFAQIEAGATRLRFVALCGDKFDWSE